MPPIPLSNAGFPAARYSHPIAVPNWRTHVCLSPDQAQRASARDASTRGTGRLQRGGRFLASRQSAVVIPSVGSSCFLLNRGIRDLGAGHGARSGGIAWLPLTGPPCSREHRERTPGRSRSMDRSSAWPYHPAQFARGFPRLGRRCDGPRTLRCNNALRQGAAYWAISNARHIATAHRSSKVRGVPVMTNVQTRGKTFSRRWTHGPRVAGWGAIHHRDLGIISAGSIDERHDHAGAAREPLAVILFPAVVLGLYTRRSAIWASTHRVNSCLSLRASCTGR